MQTKQVSFTVDVVGRIWSGHTGTYSYHFVTFPGETAIRAKAGDFESITDYEVTRITAGGDWSHSWTRRKVIRAWQDEANRDIYLESVA